MEVNWQATPCKPGCCTHESVGEIPDPSDVLVRVEGDVHASELYDKVLRDVHLGHMIALW